MPARFPNCTCVTVWRETRTHQADVGVETHLDVFPVKFDSSRSDPKRQKSATSVRINTEYIADLLGLGVISLCTGGLSSPLDVNVNDGLVRWCSEITCISEIHRRLRSSDSSIPALLGRHHLIQLNALGSILNPTQQMVSHLVMISSAVAQPIPAIINLSWPLPAILDMTRCRPTRSARSTVHFKNSCKIKTVCNALLSSSLRQ